MLIVFVILTEICAREPKITHESITGTISRFFGAMKAFKKLVGVLETLLNLITVCPLEKNTENSMLYQFLKNFY